MRIGNIELSREDFPSYQIGKDYYLRRFSFMQDTLARALQQQAMIAMQQQQNVQQPNAPKGAAQ